jgi:hypothetical protein
MYAFVSAELNLRVLTQNSSLHHSYLVTGQTKWESAAAFLRNKEKHSPTYGSSKSSLFRLHTVPCWRYFLGYRLYHSIVYNLLLPTLLVGITVFRYTRFWPPDVLCQSGLWMSSRLEGWLLTSYVFPLRRLANNWLTSRRSLQLSALLSLKHLRSDGCVACVPTIHPLLPCVANVGFRKQLLNSSVNNRSPSRCLGSNNSSSVAFPM